MENKVKYLEIFCVTKDIELKPEWIKTIVLLFCNAILTDKLNKPKGNNKTIVFTHLIEFSLQFLSKNALKLLYKQIFKKLNKVFFNALL